MIATSVQCWVGFLLCRLHLSLVHTCEISTRTRKIKCERAWNKHKNKHKKKKHFSFLLCLCLSLCLRLFLFRLFHQCEHLWNKHKHVVTSPLGACVCFIFLCLFSICLCLFHKCEPCFSFSDIQSSTSFCSECKPCDVNVPPVLRTLTYNRHLKYEEAK